MNDRKRKEKKNMHRQMMHDAKTHYASGHDGLRYYKSCNEIKSRARRLRVNKRSGQRHHGVDGTYSSD